MALFLIIVQIIRMTAQIINGKAIAEDLLNSIQAKVTARIHTGKRAPCLAVVLIGVQINLIKKLDLLSKKFYEYLWNQERALQKML